MPTPGQVQAPLLILLMGVSGSGKTTLGKLLAAQLGHCFLDADDYHSSDSIALMRSGTPLDDRLRDAWVLRLQQDLSQRRAARQGCVLAFSGLRKRHRQALMQLGFCTYAFLLEGEQQVLHSRLLARENHFMPASQLPDQLQALQSPGKDEGIDCLDCSATPSQLAALVLKRLDQQAR